MEKHYISKCYKGHLLYREIPTYEVHLIQTSGGTIYANPMSGYSQTEVTLSNTPNTDYIFKSYEVSGSTLYDENKFKFVGSDVSAIGKFKYYPNEITLNDQLWTRPLSYNDGGSGIEIRNLYGRDYGYYTRAAAERIESIYSASGFRIPIEQDFEKLFKNMGTTYKKYDGGGFRPAGTYLKSETDWGSGSGIDKFGFDLKPLGYIGAPSSWIQNVGFAFYCWGSSVTIDYSGRRYYEGLYIRYDDYITTYNKLYQQDAYFTEIGAGTPDNPTYNAHPLMLVKDI